MGSSQPLNFTRVFTEEFLFAEAKKYLKIKGPLGLEVVHDHMYPLLRFGMKVTIERPRSGIIRPGMLACFWQEGMIRPCLIKEVDENQNFKVSFLNSDDPQESFSSKYFLGEITSPKWSWLTRLKLFLRDSRTRP